MPASSSNPALATTYSLRPSYKDKPTPAKMKQVMQKVLKEHLEGQEYQSEHASQWTKEIADSIKLQLKSNEFQRYKFLVQVVIGEQRGEGVRMGCRCVWDAETDSYANETFLNDSLFCVATAFGIYLY